MPFRCRIRGLRGQGAVLTDRRVVVAKSGVNAGAVFGAKVTSYPFDLTAAIEVQTSGVRSVLIVRSAGNPGGSGFLFQRQLGKDVWSSPNTIPLNRSDRDAAEQLAERASSARASAMAPRPEASMNPSLSMADELTKLAGLRDAGVFTEEEFAAQKGRLLS